MSSPAHHRTAARSAGRTGRSRLASVAALLLAAAMLSGCIVETPGPGPHHHWWWHHDRD